MRRIYLVRTGKPSAGEGQRESADGALCAEGKRQALLLKAYFQDKNLTGVYHSTLTRAGETARWISPEAKTTAGMHEISTDSEPLPVCARRAYISLYGLLARTRGDIAVVTHGALICALMARLEDTPWSACQDQPVSYGSVSVLEENEEILHIVEKGLMPQIRDYPGIEEAMREAGCL